MKRTLFSYIIIGTCFILGLMDYILSLFLLSTGYFVEINIFAYPYFVLIPLFLFLKKDKLIIDALMFLTIFLGVVVSINLINLITYLQVIA